MKTYHKIEASKREKYLRNISNVASLSALFATEFSAPFLVSRATENIFCNALEARNVGREDSAIDAIIEKTGIGIKTFLHKNGNTLQKIAEFNKDSAMYRDLQPRDKIMTICHLRNKRLQFALDNYGIDNLIYHCITRAEDGVIGFYEVDMDFIDINNIKKIESRQNSIFFEDGKNEYSFNLTKSTLFKRFSFQDDNDIVDQIKVGIISNPYDFLDELISMSDQNTMLNPTFHNSIIIPLYSFSNSKGKFIGEKSGLNQWNAGGRKRNENEIYIPISSKINKSFTEFFPARDVKFNMLLPNGKNLSVKICQENNKALMSDPNRDLGEWLLRDVLKIEPGTLLDYETLKIIGIDSVKISKLSQHQYEIDFMELGAYDEFALINNL